MTRTLVRGLAAVAGTSLALGLGLVAPTAQATPATDSGSGWLSAQLTDGLLTYDFYGPYTDTGSSIDAALSFTELGVQPAAVQSIVVAVKGRAATYTRPGGGTTVSAGATAKTLVLAQATGSSVGDFGGVDLLGQLEARVATAAPITGRVQDDWENVGEYSADYANVISQALAVRGLDTAGSARAAAASDFLLAQQCTPGYFRESFAAADAAEQGCVDGFGDASVDATAQAVLALHAAAEAGTADEIAAAGDWLASFQNGDGSFDSGQGEYAFASNGNSTGLAARALAVAGEPAAAAKAATWLRLHQAANAGTCTTYAAADLGAIAYDDTALKAARGGPIETVDVGEWIRTTVQALPALKILPVAQLALTGPTGYVPAGSQHVLAIAGLPSGLPACFTGDGTTTRLTGTAGSLQRTVTVPATTSDVTYSVAGLDGAATLTVKALAATKLKLALDKLVDKGAKQKVKVTGLAPSEKVTVLVQGKKVDKGTANAAGVFKAVFKATGKPGKRKLTAVGQFDNRSGRATFKVVR